MPLNHVQIRAFHAVASEASFTRAAERLHLTQPTLSGQVKALEETYGIKLFERRGRGIELTEIGRALHDLTRQQFAIEAAAEELLSAARGLLRGNIRIHADAPYLVMPVVAVFKRRYPGITLGLAFGNSEQVLGAIFERRADVGVLPESGRDPRLYAFPFRRDDLVVFVDRGHSWSRRRSVRIEELAGQRMVLRERGSTTRAIFEGALARAGVSLGETLEIGTREAVREAVAAGLGIGAVADSEFVEDARLHKLALKGPGLRATTLAVCLAERREVRVVRAFLDVMQSMAEP